jgi:hypothetical protein
MKDNMKSQDKDDEESDRCDAPAATTSNLKTSEKGKAKNLDEKDFGAQGQHNDGTEAETQSRASAAKR